MASGRAFDEYAEIVEDDDDMGDYSTAAEASSYELPRDRLQLTNVLGMSH